MSAAAKDFLFQLQSLIARAGSDLSLRKSLTTDALSALLQNGLTPPENACFEVAEDKTPSGVVKQGSRFCLNLPNLSDLNQITFSKNQYTKLALNTPPFNSEEVVLEAEAETTTTTSTESTTTTTVNASDPSISASVVVVDLVIVTSTTNIMN